MVVVQITLASKAEFMLHRALVTAVVSVDQVLFQALLDDKQGE
jgi:hypothetical protein